MLLTAAIFFLLVAIAAGVLSLTVKATLFPVVLFVVSFLMFLWAGITHMRERRRGTRR